MKLSQDFHDVGDNLMKGISTLEHPHKRIWTQLCRLYKELNDCEPGYFVEDDMPKILPYWERLNVNEHFVDEEDAEKVLRHNIGLMIDPEGYVKERNNFICIMSAKRRAAMLEAKERLNQERQRKMIGDQERPEESAVETWEEDFHYADEPKRKRRGRPPKTQ